MPPQTPESTFFPPGGEPVNVGQPPGMDPAVFFQFQQTLNKLVRIMGDPKQPRGTRDQAKVAFDKMTQSLKRVGLDVTSVQEGGLPGTEGILQPLDPGAPPDMGINVPAGFMPPQASLGARARAAGTLAAPPSAPPPVPAAAPAPPGPAVSPLPFPLVSPRATEQAPTPGAEEIGPPVPAQRVPDTGVIEPEIMPEEPESPTLAALRAALTEAPPRRKERQFGKVEGIALAFLAGLKGIEAAMPFLQLREQRTQREFESEMEGFQTRQRGLMGLSELEQREQARRETAMLRRETMQATRLMQAARLDQMTTSNMFRAAHLKLAQERSEREAARFKRPPASLLEGIADMGDALRNLEELIPLVSEGAGGPVFGRLQLSPDTWRAEALWGNIRTLISPERIGRAVTGIEVSGVGKGFFDVGIANIRSKQLNVLRQFKSYLESRLGTFAQVYDPGVVYGAAGVEGHVIGDSYDRQPRPELLPGTVPVPESELLLYDDGEVE